MKTRAALAVTCLIGLLAPAAASAAFVQRSVTNLTLSGNAFRFVGDNNSQLTSVSGSTPAGAR